MSKIVFEAEAGIDCLQILLDGLDWGTGSAGRTIETGANRTADARVTNSPRPDGADYMLLTLADR